MKKQTKVDWLLWGGNIAVAIWVACEAVGVSGRLWEHYQLVDETPPPVPYDLDALTTPDSVAVAPQLATWVDEANQGLTTSVSAPTAPAEIAGSEQTSLAPSLVQLFHPADDQASWHASKGGGSALPHESLVLNPSFPTPLRTVHLRSWCVHPRPDRSWEDLVRLSKQLADPAIGLPPEDVSDVLEHWRPSASKQTSDSGWKLLDRQLASLVPKLRAKGGKGNRKTNAQDWVRLPTEVDPKSIAEAEKLTAALNGTLKQATVPPMSDPPRRRSLPLNLSIEPFLKRLNLPDGFASEAKALANLEPQDPLLLRFVKRAIEEIDALPSEDPVPLVRIPKWVDRVAVATGDPQLMQRLRSMVAEGTFDLSPENMDRWIGVALADGDPSWAEALIAALPDHPLPVRWELHREAIRSNPGWTNYAAAIEMISDDPDTLLLPYLQQSSAAGWVAKQWIIDRRQWSPKMIQAVADWVRESSTDPEPVRWLAATLPDRLTGIALAKRLGPDETNSAWPILVQVLPPDQIPPNVWQGLDENSLTDLILRTFASDQPLNWQAVGAALQGVANRPKSLRRADQIDWAVALRTIRFVSKSQSLPEGYLDVAGVCGARHTAASMDRIARMPNPYVTPEQAMSLALASREAQ